MERPAESATDPAEPRAAAAGSEVPRLGDLGRETTAARFAFIDGIRGIAALGITSYHIWRYEPTPQTAQDFVPGFVDALLQRTWIGVQMLLVISGFVIAYTLRNTWVSPRAVASFVFRRVVRLVPAYWATILVVILLAVACDTRTLPAPFDDTLTAVRVLTHLAFLQDIFGQTSLSAGLWTLCIEVQFYVVFVLGWGIAQRMRRSPPQDAEHSGRSVRPPGACLLLLFGTPAACSLFLWSRQDSTEPWVTHFLGMFFLGMMTWWTLDRTVPLWSFFVAVAVVVVSSAIDWRVEPAVALTTALALFAAGRMGHMHDWLNYRWLQYCGRISYSLYLIHYPVSHLVSWFGWRACGNEPTPVQATAILLAAFGLSLIASHLLYTLVEAPCNRWAARRKAK